MKGSINGTTADPVNDIVKGESCKFYDGTLSEGDPVIVREADDSILGKGTLNADSVDVGPACAFTFEVRGIPSGEPGYSVLIEPYEPVVVTEQEMRSDSFGLITRDATDVLMGNGKRPIEVSTS